MLVAVGSWRGSPGATTAALGLARSWPTEAKTYLAECDPCGGTLVPRFLMRGPRGLAALAGQARRSGDLSLLDEHAVSAPNGARVLTGPEDGRQLRAALSALLVSDGVLERAADDPDTVLIADVGRVDSDVPETASLLLLADVLMLAVRPVPEQILSLAGTNERARRPHRDTGLLLIGPGYPSAHVAELLQLPVFGQLPVIPAGVAATWQRLTRRDSFRAAATKAGQAVITHVAAEISAARLAVQHAELATFDGGARV